jgi:phosphatidate cytidylyltransferase
MTVAASAAELARSSAGRLGLALAGGLALILVMERGRLADLRSRVLFLRWRTWALTAPLFVAAVLGPTALSVAFVAALSVQAVRELGALAQLPRRWVAGLAVVAVATPVVAAGSLPAWRALPPLVFVVAALAAVTTGDVRSGLHRLVWGTFAVAYIPVLLSYFVVMRTHVPGGSGLLLAVGTAVALSDVGAFTAGVLAGRHPLAPAISPAKTWEGVLGNVAGAYLGFGLMAFALPPGLPPVIAWLLPLVVAGGCVLGDLVESLVKRHAGTKDAGGCLPGFGGVLDRIDSLLIVLPLAYTLVAGLR